MKKLSKSRKEKISNIDFSKSYSPAEAIKILKDNTYTKFDETLDIAINLGINPEKTDQNIRGVMNLPKGSGKKIRIAVIVKDDKTKEATATGAAADTPHFSSSNLLNSAASITDKEDKSSTILFKSAIMFSPFKT